MLELLKEIILDSQTEPLVTGVTRHLPYERVKGKAFVCIGVRRCGKTTLLHQIMSDLLGQGVSRDNLLYINFFDDRLTELKQGHLSQVMEAYYSLYPEKKGKETVYCLFDEVQEVKGWEAVVDRLLRTEKCEVFLSGSSANMLSREIATQMRGRSLAWELFPFSFREFLDYRGGQGTLLTSRNRLLVQKHFAEYWKKGGFPEGFDVSDRIRMMIHQEYYRAILHRDVIERYDAIHPQAVVQAGYRLISSAGSLYTLNRITEYLKSLGFKVSHAFVSECLQWFADAYFLFTVKRFDPSVARQNVNPRKAYCVDHALISSVTSGIQKDAGHLLENLVFVDLRRRTDRIHYYRTSRDGEVDFVWLDECARRNLVQVCYSLQDPKTRKRELQSLKDAMSELRLKEATVVSFNEEETVQDGDNIIRVLPVWKYLLQS